MRKRLYISIICFIVFSPAKANESDLNSLVSVDYKDQSFESVILDLRQRFGIRFFIDPGRVFVSSNLRINLNLSQKPILEILDSICFQTGTGYSIAEGHIALFRLKDVIEDQQQDLSHNVLSTGSSFSDTIEEPTLLSASGTQEPDQLHESMQACSSETQHVVENIPDVQVKTIAAQYLNFTNLQKATAATYDPSTPPTFYFKAPVNLQDTIPFSNTQSQESSARKVPIFKLGLVYSLDFIYLSSAEWQNKDFTYQTAYNYSLGLKGKIRLWERWSLQLQTNYTTRNFEIFYNLNAADPSDPFIPEKTMVKSAYLEISILINYKWITTNTWSFSTELGLLTAMILNHKKNTYHGDRTEMETPSFLTGAMRPQLWGIQAGLEIHYQLSNLLTIQILPQSQFYFTSINRQAPAIQLRTNQVAFGFIYTF